MMYIILPLFIGTTELLLIGGMALLLFGGKKLPEMMRGLGQGVREFKKGVNDDGEDKAHNTTDNDGKDVAEDDKSCKMSEEKSNDKDVVATDE